MKFSIVIPLYNKASYISRALNSVLAQSYNDWECIVVDDGSTDKGPEIVESYKDKRIRMLQQKNAGPSAARNRGAREANGEWIALLDADDYWLDYHLYNLADLTTRHPQCRVVAGNFCIECPGSRLILPNFMPYHESTTVQDYLSWNASRKGPLVNSSSTAVRKDLWHETGGFRESFRLAEDTDFWCRLSLNTDFAIHHTPSSVYFQDYSDNSTRTCLYIGDAPFADLRTAIPHNLRWAYDEFLASYRMMILAPGTLLTGNKKLARRMATASLGTTSSKRATIILALSLLPTRLLRKVYQLYRASRNLGLPRMLSVSQTLDDSHNTAF